MKIKLFFCCTIAFLIMQNQNAKAQDLHQLLTKLKSKVGEVQIDKTLFRQTIDILDAEKAKIKYTVVEIDEKGKSVTMAYEYYLSDIDKNTIIRKPSGKKLFVSFSTNNNQKFIKQFKEDKLDSYTNNIEILVLSPDEAQEIMTLVKTAIPLVKSSEKAWSTNTDALNWLKTNLGAVSTSSGNSVQSFSISDRKDYLVSFNVNKTDLKGVSTEEKYEFNLMDINKNKLQVKISGAQLSVEVETKGNDKYVKYSKNNVQQNYADNFEILAQDIDQARNIISAIGTAITKSKSKMPEFKNIQSSLDFIKTNHSEIILDSKTIKQKINFTPGQGTQIVLSIIESDQKGKNIEFLYDFYLADIETNSLNFKVSGKKITIFFSTRNKAKFIKYSKDNVLQSYQDEIELVEPDIETTREIVEALKYSIKASEIKPITWSNMTEAISFLKSNIKGESIGTDQYKLSFEAANTEPFLSKLLKSKTDVKGVTIEQSFEFYPHMLEPNSVKIESEGKYLAITIGTKNKKSFIKTYKDAKQQNYEDELEIMAFDAKQAKDIAEALKYIANNGKPKDKDWSSKQTAMNFAKENIHDFKTEGKEIKQKFELLNNDPCKVVFTVNTTDDKGKTTEDIYEFSMNDMNKMMVEYKVSGKNIYINMTCKNKEKFVKAYKNGVQQSYGSDVEILGDDVETAKNIADALRSTIILCEQ